MTSKFLTFVAILLIVHVADGTELTVLQTKIQDILLLQQIFEKLSGYFIIDC